MTDIEALTLAPTARRRPGANDSRTARDRLQPALLDRLMDDAPHLRREPHEAAMITHTALRQAVLRDLRWLLNTMNLQAREDLASYPAARDSTVNFGLPPLAGKRMSEIDWIDVEDSIRAAIIHFEPRILPHSVSVACVTQARELNHHNVLSLEIRGLLWCVPFPRELLLRTDIDLESGHMDLSDLGGA